MKHNIPAFPTIEAASYIGGLSANRLGLTKREIFAMYAMQGLVEIDYTITPEDVAKKAVKQADWLLKALEEDNE